MLREILNKAKPSPEEKLAAAIKLLKEAEQDIGSSRHFNHMVAAKCIKKAIKQGEVAQETIELGED